MRANLNWCKILCAARLNALCSITFEWVLTRPEAELLGVQYYFWPVNDDIVIKNTNHWLLAGAGLRDRVTGQSYGTEICWLGFAVTKPIEARQTVLPTLSFWPSPQSIQGLKLATAT